MNTILEVLRAGRDRIARGWTQGAYARNADGVVVGSDDPTASCWCSLGAIGEDTTPRSHDVLDAYIALREALPSRGSIGFNDDPDTTQTDVLALFDRAIAALETP